MVKCFYDSRFLFLWANGRLSGAGMRIVVVFVFPDSQLCFYLPDIGRMNLKPVAFFHKGANVLIGGNKTHIHFQIRGTDGDFQSVCYFFPPKQTTVSSVLRFGRKFPSMSKHTSQSASLLSL